MKDSYIAGGDMIESEDFPALKYDPETSYFWWKYRTSSRCKMNKPAGYFDNRSGYRYIRYNNKSYLCHRIAWKFYTGLWPKNEIDHINIIKTDNRIINLRESTRSENQCNRSKPSDNRSGFKGIFWHKHKKIWRAQVKKGDNKVTRQFANLDAAKLWVSEQREELHGEFVRHK